MKVRTTPPPSGHDPDEDTKPETKSRISVTLEDTEGNPVDNLTTEASRVILSLDDYTDDEIQSFTRIVIALTANTNSNNYRLDSSSRGNFNKTALNLSKTGAAINGDYRKISFWAKVTSDNTDPEIELAVGLYSYYDADTNTGNRIGELQTIKLRTDKYVDYGCNDCFSCSGDYCLIEDMCNCDSACKHIGCKESN